MEDVSGPEGGFKQWVARIAREVGVAYSTKTERDAAVEFVRSHRLSIAHAKIRRAESEAAQSRMATRSTGRSEAVKRLFTKARTETKPIPDGGARPPAKASGWSWLRARFALPRKPVWR